MAKVKRALVYVASGCEDSARMLQRLEADGFVVDVVDVSANPEKITELLKLTGGRRVVPVVVAGGRIDVQPGGGGSEF